MAHRFNYCIPCCTNVPCSHIFTHLCEDPRRLTVWGWSCWARACLPLLQGQTNNPAAAATCAPPSNPGKSLSSPQWELSRPLSSTPGTLESTRGVGGRLLEGHPVKPMLPGPLLSVHLSISPATSLSELPASACQGAERLTGQVALLLGSAITLILTLSSLLPSRSFHWNPASLPSLLQRRRDRKEESREGQGELSVNVHTVSAHLVLRTTLGGRHCYPVVQMRKLRLRGVK